MGLLRRKKEKSNENVVNVPAEVSRLEELCGGDKQLYEDLTRLLILDPRKIIQPLETFAKDGAKFEMEGNRLKAEVSYRIAGGMAMYTGDVQGVRNYFGRAAVIAGDSRKEYARVAQKAEEAVRVAREFYRSEPELKTSP